MSHIYTGVWTEYLPGSTQQHLTVTDGAAFMILTVVSLLITFSLQSCWIAAYLLLKPHLPRGLRSLRQLQDQQNVGAFTVFTSFAKAFVKERGGLLQYLWPSLLIFSASALFLVAAIGIPIAAAWGLTYGTQEVPPVKTSGSTCQFWIGTDRAVVTMRNTNLTIAASEYYQACYLQHSPLSCQSNMAEDRLDWTEIDSASCPFNESVCLNTGADATVRLETPWIAVSKLGINAATKLHLKRSLTCSVLNTEAFQEPASQGSVDVEFTLAFGTDQTYEYDVRDLSLVAPGYRLTTIPQTASYPPALDSRLNVTGGFVTVVLLQAPGVFFPEAVDDPMFSAHQDYLFPVSGLRWAADNLVGVAGCVDQFMVCNNATGSCSPWTSPEDLLIISGNDPLIKSTADQSALNIIQYVLTSSSLQYTITGRGSSALAAQRAMTSQNQERLGPRPWREEVNTWFGVSLAKLQMSVLSIAYPTPFLSTDGLVAFPANSGTGQLCKMIKSREGEYTNMHWAGFIATLVVCCVAGAAAEVFRIWRTRRDGAHQTSMIPLVNHPNKPPLSPHPPSTSQSSLTHTPNPTAPPAAPAAPTPTSPISPPPPSPSPSPSPAATQTTAPLLQHNAPAAAAAAPTSPVRPLTRT